MLAASKHPAWVSHKWAEIFQKSWAFKLWKLGFNFIVLIWLFSLWGGFPPPPFFFSCPKKGKAFETLAFNLSNLGNIFYVKRGDKLLWTHLRIYSTLTVCWLTHSICLEIQGLVQIFFMEQVSHSCLEWPNSVQGGYKLCLCLRISGFMTADAFNPFACPFCANTWIVWFTSSAVHKKLISELEVLF